MLASTATTYGVRRYRAVQDVPAELRAGWLFLPSVVPPRTPWPVVNHAVLRVGRRLMRRQTPVDPRVRMQHHTIPADDGAGEVPVYLYATPRRPTPGPALLWIHGGDLVFGNAAQDHDLCSDLAARLEILVVSVDYRLAPDHPFPAAHEDCFTALRWLHRNAVLGADPGRIAVGGASAGGGLAATLAQHAHDAGLPVSFELLVYPMLDDRTALRTHHGHRGRLAFTPAMNRYGWTHYLGHRPTTADPGRYAAAARRCDLSQMPPTWIGVGDLDLLHDEAVDYAHRLQAAGVPCQLHVEPGMYHGADVQLASSVASMRTFRQRLTDALENALTPPQKR